MLKQYQGNYLIEILYQCRKIARIIIIFSYIVNILMFSMPIYAMQVLDQVLLSGSLDVLIWLTVIILIISFLIIFIQIARALIMLEIGYWIENKIYKKLLYLHYNSFNKNYANYDIIKDFRIIKSFFSSSIAISIVDVPWSIVLLVPLFYFHMAIGYIGLISVVLIITTNIYFEKNMNYIIANYNNNIDMLNKNMEHVLLLSLYSDNFNSKNNMLNRHYIINIELQYIYKVIIKMQIFVSEIIKLFRLLSYIFIVAIGSYLIILGKITSGIIIASLSVVGKLLSPFESMLYSWRYIVSVYTSFSRINNYFSNLQNDVKNNKKSFLLLGNLHTDNVFYIYQNKPLVKNVNFCLKNGEILLLLGKNDSGKTVLLKIISGIIKPNFGDIKISGISIRDIDSKKLDSYIGYLPQDIYIFPGTIKENICNMKINININNVILCSRLSGFYKYMKKIENNYNTYINCYNGSISRSQKQKIGISRTFYRNARILIFDSPDTNLDKDNENDFITSMCIIKKKIVTAVITSRNKQLYKYADKVAIIDNGVLISFYKKKYTCLPNNLYLYKQC